LYAASKTVFLKSKTVFLKSKTVFLKPSIINFLWKKSPTAKTPVKNQRFLEKSVVQINKACWPYQKWLKTFYSL